MKKIKIALSFKLLALMLTAYSLQLNAQTSGFIVNVDKASTTYLTWKVPGDYSAYDSLHFVVKACTTSSDCGQLIKKNCGVTYSKPHSTLTCTLYVDETASFNAAKYYFSIYAYGVDTVAVRSGTFNLQLNGQTPIDGVASTSPIYTIALSPPNYDSTMIVGFNVDSTWRELNIDDVRNVMGTGGGGTPDSVIFPYETNPWDKVASDDVTLTGTQTVTGVKTFSDTLKTTIISEDSLTILSTGLYLTSELATNPTFDENINGWVKNLTPVTFEWVASGGGFTGAMHIVNNGNADGARYADTLETQIGAVFSLDLSISSLTATGINVRESLNGFFDTTLTATGLHQLSFETGFWNDGIIKVEIRQSGTGSSELYVDNFSILPYKAPKIIFDSKSNITVESDTFTVNSNVINIEGLILISDYVLQANVDAWTSGLTTTSNLLKLGKPNREIYFNNGAYSDFWLLDYIQHPYNLPNGNQIMREFRTDYYNDTLKTFQSIANLTYLDTVGTGIWHPDGFSYVHNQNALGLGDLPDSTTAVFNGAGVVGVQFAISEANKTAGAKRLGMKVKGFEFKFNSTPYYTYPVVYGYYSDLTTNTPSLETAYHFYGLGNYPSYFGGNIVTDGKITLRNPRNPGIDDANIEFEQDTVNNEIGIRVANRIVTYGDTPRFILDDGGMYGEIQAGGLTAPRVWVFPNKGGTVALLDDIEEAGLDTNTFNDLFNTAIDTMVSDTSIHTAAQIDTATARVLRLDVSIDSLNSLISTLSTLIAELKGGTTGQSLTKTNGTDFNFQWATVGAVDLSDTTPPAAPTSLTATADNDTAKVRLTWTDPADSDLDSVRIYRAVVADTTAYTYLARVPAGTEAYTNTGLAETTAYWYKLRAVDDSSNVSGYSNRDSALTFTSGGGSYETGNLRFEYLASSLSAGQIGRKYSAGAWHDEIVDSTLGAVPTVAAYADADSGVVFWGASSGCQYVKGDCPSDLLTSGNSIEMVIHIADATAGQLFLGMRYNSPTIRIFETGINSSSQLYCYTYYDGSETSFTVSPTTYLGDYIHLVVTTNGSGTLTMYINGSSQSDAGNGGLTIGSAGIYVGEDSGSYNASDNTAIHYIRIYDDVLTSGEVSTNYGWAQDEGYVP